MGFWYTAMDYGAVMTNWYNLIAATNEIDRDGDAEFVDVLRDTHRLLTTRLGLQMVILVEPGEEESR